MASISPLIGLGIATAGIPDALGKGTDLKQAREDRRDQAKQRKQEGDLRLQQLQSSVDQQPLQDQQLQQQLQMQSMQLGQLQKKITTGDTNTALDRFFASGDPQPINQFLQDYKDDPKVHAAFGQAVHVDKLDTSNEEDKKLLLQAQVPQEALDALDGKKDGKVDTTNLDWDAIKKRFLKVTHAGGTTSVVDMLAIAGHTGYQKYAQKEALAKALQLAQIQKAQTSGLTANQKDAVALAEAKGTTPGAELQNIIAGKARHDPNDTLTSREKEAEVLAKANGTTVAEELQKLIDNSVSHNPNDTLTSLQKDANAIAAARDRITTAKAKGAQPLRADTVLSNLGKEKLGGVTAGKQVIAEQARTTLKSLSFDKMTQDEMKSNPAVRNAINRIEEAHPISEAQQKQLIDLNSLVALSGSASKLSSSQTGLLDSFTSGVKRYVSNDVTDQQTKSAYEALIGTFRHDLLGAAMSDSELKLFTKAYNTDRQKVGPVLSGLKAALIQVKSKLSTISDLNDPSVVKFRTGKSITDIHDSIRGIDKRISFLNKVSAGMPPKEAASQVAKEFTPKQPVDIDKALGF